MRRKLLSLAGLALLFCAVSLVAVIVSGQAGTRAIDAVLGPWFSLCAAVTPAGWQVRGNVLLGLAWMVSGLLAYSFVASAACLVVWSVGAKVWAVRRR